VDQVSGVTLLGNISYFVYEDILLFFNGIWSSVMLYREYPEKSFKSFSLLANALPVGIPAELIFFRFLGNRFSEGYFPAETFHNAYPSAGMPTGRVFAEWLKDLKEK